MAEQQRRRFIDASEWFRRREQAREQATDTAPRDYQRPVSVAPVRGRRPGRPPASARPRTPAVDAAGLLDRILAGEGNTAR